MAIPEMKVYPRSGDKETIYLQNVITHPNIRVGDYTIYNDFVNDPDEFASITLNRSSNVTNAYEFLNEWQKIRTKTIATILIFLDFII